MVTDTTLNISYVATVSTPSAKNRQQKRKGAREVRQVELQADEHDKLKPETATTYRALAARANYLSRDRPDASYASKELCRDC